MVSLWAARHSPSPQPAAPADGEEGEAAADDPQRPDVRPVAAETMRLATALRRAVETADVDWQEADWRSWAMDDGSTLRLARELEDHVRLLALLAERRQR